MGWRFADDVEEFAAAALPFLQQDPVRHTVTLTATGEARRRRRQPSGTLYGWWLGAEGRVTGTVLHSPPFELLVEAVPDEAVGPLVDELADRRHPLGGVFGPSATAAHLAALWTRRDGGDGKSGGRGANGTAHLQLAQRLYRLDSLADPTPPPPGAVRPADEDDLELLADWLAAFDAEAGTSTPNISDWLRDRLASQLIMLWTIGDDDKRRPVAMAARSRPIMGMVRLGPVYTAPDDRGCGFGGAVTAAATQRALGGGAAHVVLFTDLANATSNALYRRLGFVPFEDRLTVRFSP